MRRSLTTITVMLLTLLVGACGRAVDAPDVAAPSPSRAETSPAMQRCTNPQDGYSVSYPTNWHTNSGEVLPTCTVFDDGPIELTQGSEVPFDAALFLQVIDRPISHLDDDPAIEVIDRRTRQIGGRDAVEVRFRSTGQALLPEEVHGHRILVRLQEGTTLHASSYDLDERPLDDNLDTMRQMLRTLDTPVVTPSTRSTPSPPPFRSSTQTDTSVQPRDAVWNDLRG